MIFRQFLDQRSHSYAYLLGCSSSGQALMIDPVREDAALYLAVLDEMGLSLKHVLETHLHADHYSAAAVLRAATGASVGTPERSVLNADYWVAEPQTIHFGVRALEVLDTPGHTPSCVSYYCEGRLFTGDCLWIGDCGYEAQQESDAGRLFDSITHKLLRFPDETLLYPGHDAQGRQVSCIGEARRNGAWFCGVTRDEFMARLARRPCHFSTAESDYRLVNCRCGTCF